MDCIVWNVFIKDDTARSEKMICCQRTDTIPLLARGIAHENAFTRFSPKLHLLFLWDQSEASYSPDTKMGDVWLMAVECLKRSDVVGESVCDGEVIQVHGCQGSLSPIH